MIINPGDFNDHYMVVNTSILKTTNNGATVSDITPPFPGASDFFLLSSQNPEIIILLLLVIEMVLTGLLMPEPTGLPYPVLVADGAWLQVLPTLPGYILPGTMICFQDMALSNVPMIMVITGCQ
ncbi:MAG: hypothetical protein IPK57_17565 [Chitinophagaceae bacterium]|nr:hypothetical protein [Chitinophagaceae bacterium]